MAAASCVVVESVHSGVKSSLFVGVDRVIHTSPWRPWNMGHRTSKDGPYSALNRHNHNPCSEECNCRWRLFAANAGKDARRTYFFVTLSHKCRVKQTLTREMKNMTPIWICMASLTLSRLPQTRVLCVSADGGADAHSQYLSLLNLQPSSW